MDFKSLHELVDSIQHGACAGELHGLICGFLTAGSRPSAAGWVDILDDWFETSGPGTDLGQQVVHIAAQTLEQLLDVELSFQLLVPDDEAPLADRLREVGGWCRGFLHGFGLSGNYQQEDLSDDAAELLADLAEISKMSDQPDEDDTENHYMEILEYLRMGTIVLFAEHGQPVLH